MHNHTPHNNEHEVLIVGAGPAGLASAITLARYGVDVLVVEKHAGTSPFPKATGVSTRTMEILRSWGLEDDVRAGAMEAQPALAVAQTLLDPPLATVPFGYPTTEEALAVSPSLPAAVPQDHLEPVLLAHLREQGGRVAFETELVGLTQDDTGAVVDLRDVRSGRHSRVHAQYVIGADGSRSGVRQRAGIGVDDLGTLGQFVAVTFRADLTRRLPQRWALTAVQATGAEGMFVPTGRNDRWVYAREWHPELGEEIGDYTPARVLDMLRTGTGLTDLKAQVLSVTTFTMGAQVATAFRAGRTFLVGDAAHQTTPVGAVGMNIAIHAAHNLGWKLAWVLRGWAGEQLLDSYEAERRPVGAAASLQSLDRGPRSTTDALTWDLHARYGRTSGDAASPGGRAPHAWVRDAGGEVSTLDLVEGRLTLLTGVDGAAWATAATRMAAREGLPLRALVVGADLDDEEGCFAARYDLHSGGAVLVRPDGYIAWRAEAPASDPDHELRRAAQTSLARLALTA